MIILIENLKLSVDKKIYDRGVELSNQNQVKINRIGLESFEAAVTDEGQFEVQVNERDGNIFSTCSCQNWHTCSHVVAALLTARRHYVKHRANMIYLTTHPGWRNFFSDLIDVQQSSLPARTMATPPWQIVYFFKWHQDNWSVTPNKAIIRKDGKLDQVQKISPEEVQQGNLLQAAHDPMIIAYLGQYGSAFNPILSSTSRQQNLKYMEYPIDYGARLGNLLDLLRDSLVYLEKDDSYERLEIAEDAGQIEFEFVEHRKDIQFLPRVIWNNHREPLDARYRVLTENPIWLNRGRRLIKISNLEYGKLVIPFTRPAITVTIPREDLVTFIQTSYSVLSQYVELPRPPGFETTKFSELSRKRLYLKENDHQLEVYLRFLYQDIEVDLFDVQDRFYKLDQQQKVLIEIVRDREVEQQVWQKLKATGLKVSNRGCLRAAESKAIDWMMLHVPELVRQDFEIYGQESLKKYKVRTGYPNVRLSISSGIDWFDLNIEIDIDGIMLSLQELKKAMSFQSRFVKLADGSIAQLPETWYKKLLHLFSFGKLEERKIRLSHLHITLIDQLSEQAAWFQTDQKYSDIIGRLSSFTGIKSRELPAKIDGILRPYQKAGFDWFYFLQEFNFGGCLADDMGLGKTLQALTLLLKEKENNNKVPSLIVCPTSVVFNWEREVEKFTPDLKVFRHTSVERKKNTDLFANFDIILTSYGVMRQDIAFLKDYRFHYVILDESQKIKNPISQTAKAARLLQARHRLVLTGTPVENNTVELWSQFAFLNPGMLGNLAFYKREFTTPIEKRKSEDTSAYLKKLIFPFILRRNKESVARELPPKVEQTYFCPMNPAQHKLYVHWRDYYRARILRKIDEEGIEKSRFNILEGLVKLRLIASHPNLVDVTIWEDSGKFEILKEFVTNILAEDHKIIIFSQFVKMLRLIRKYLDEFKIPYEYLDGHTRDREKCVNRFQTETGVKIFLISLKAGGTGLNLTAADYVILFDPWWNPAVEIQATDRAHRIGQDKKVFVYRFITKDSVEEKIMELQQQKKELVSNLISTDTSIFKSLTKENIEELFS